MRLHPNSPLKFIPVDIVALFIDTIEPHMSLLEKLLAHLDFSPIDWFLIFVVVNKHDRDFYFFESLKPFVREIPWQYYLLKGFPIPKDLFAFFTNFTGTKR